MRSWILMAAFAVLPGVGCTHVALERRTVNQASTLTNLQYRQALDNLAMFACHRDSLPWHLKLSTASVQVVDQTTGGFLDSIVAGKPPTTYTFTSSITGQRGVVNQWGGLPTVDPDSLQLLVLAYQKALDPMDADNTIRRGLFAKIAEISVHYNLVLTKDTMDKVIDTSVREESRRWQMKRKNEELHENLEKVFEQVARLSRPLTEIQVDNYAQRLSSKITEETRGEARAKLQIQQAQQSVAIQQARIGVEDQIVSLTREASGLPYIPRYPVTGRAEHNPYAIHLAQNKIKALLELAEAPQFTMPWVEVVCHRHDLPKCECHVGHFSGCGRDCHVYVRREHLATLRDFTVILLSLAPIEAQESPSAVTAGTVTYSPTAGGIR